MSIISLITDFGLVDSYLGSMKGVILGINPKATIVDISHSVGAQNIRKAAFLLSTTYPFFPKGTIHVIVVDPGVGSKRKILCVKTPSYYFLAPDNGLLTPVLHSGITPLIVREVSNPLFFRKEISSTFHGRDKFAPVGAHLSKKNIFNRLGPIIDQYETISWPTPRVEKNKITGKVIHIDTFGNLVTNIERRHLIKFKTHPVSMSVRDTRISRWVNSYLEGEKGEIVAVINSNNYFEIAIHGGSAANKTKTPVESEVILLW